jgi:hypothetical protein
VGRWWAPPSVHLGWGGWKLIYCAVARMSPIGGCWQVVSALGAWWERLGTEGLLGEPRDVPHEITCTSISWP